MRSVKILEPSFECTYCDVVAYMTWETVLFNGYYTDFRCVKCASCGKNMLFLVDHQNSDAMQIFPLTTDAPPPNQDMPDDLKTLYKEAAMVKPFSPRGAAAILRLCLQKICTHLARQDGSIAENLDRLKKSDDPIPERFLKAAHAVRVIGNNAVHPGLINFDDQDTDETVNGLFVLINSLVDNQITQLKTIDQIIASQPRQIQDKILKPLQNKNDS